MAEEDAVLSPTQGYHSYAFLLSLTKSVAPELSEHIHTMDGPKPFTTSPLRGKFACGGGKVCSGTAYWLRFTFFEDSLFAQFAHSLMMSLGQEKRVHLGTALFKLAEVITHPQGDPWAGFDRFDDIWGRASPNKIVSLLFSSPITFRSGGKRNVTFPQPELVFGSYLSKWNAYSSTVFDDKLREYLQQHVIPARYKLETRILNFGSYQEVGFEGKCSFIMTESIPEEILRQINALANFSFYAGTGAKTTMGMGQTRRISNAGALSHGTRRYAQERG